MSKNKDELNALKKEVENVNEKLHELTPEELEQVTGGCGGVVFDCGGGTFDVSILNPDFTPVEAAHR